VAGLLTSLVGVAFETSPVSFCAFNNFGENGVLAQRPGGDYAQVHLELARMDAIGAQPIARRFDAMELKPRLEA
jgi:hypothetical protein